jgi:hypothetical protein
VTRKANAHVLPYVAEFLATEDCREIVVLLGQGFIRRELFPDLGLAVEHDKAGGHLACGSEETRAETVGAVCGGGECG